MEPPASFSAQEKLWTTGFSITRNQPSSYHHICKNKEFEHDGVLLALSTIGCKCREIRRSPEYAKLPHEILEDETLLDLIELVLRAGPLGTKKQKERIEALRAARVESLARLHNTPLALKPIVGNESSKEATTAFTDDEPLPRVVLIDDDIAIGNLIYNWAQSFLDDDVNVVSI